jgi:hypothetical protein
MDKIIFLDLDGILNSENYFSEIKPIWFKPEEILSGKNLDEAIDPKAVTQLNRIIDETGANIVLSSHWRLWLPLSKICDILVVRGLKKQFVKNFIDKTPVGSGERQKDIKLWLSENKDIKNFIILDDKPKSDFIEIIDHFVHCKEKKGLTIKRANKAIKLLNQ